MVASPDMAVMLVERALASGALSEVPTERSTLEAFLDQHLQLTIESSLGQATAEFVCSEVSRVVANLPLSSSPAPAPSPAAPPAAEDTGRVTEAGRPAPVLHADGDGRSGTDPSMPEFTLDRAALDSDVPDFDADGDTAANTDVRQEGERTTLEFGSAPPDEGPDLASALEPEVESPEAASTKAPNDVGRVTPPPLPVRGSVPPPLPPSSAGQVAAESGRKSGPPPLPKHRHTPQLDLRVPDEQRPDYQAPATIASPALADDPIETEAASPAEAAKDSTAVEEEHTSEADAADFDIDIDTSSIDATEPATAFGDRTPITPPEPIGDLAPPAPAAHLASDALAPPSSRQVKNTRPGGIHAVGATPLPPEPETLDLSTMNWPAPPDESVLTGPPPSSDDLGEFLFASLSDVPDLGAPSDQDAPMGDAAIGDAEFERAFRASIQDPRMALDPDAVLAGKVQVVVPVAGPPDDLLAHVGSTEASQTTSLEPAQTHGSASPPSLLDSGSMGLADLVEPESKPPHPDLVPTDPAPVLDDELTLEPPAIEVAAPLDLPAPELASAPLAQPEPDPVPVAAPEPEPDPITVASPEPDPVIVAAPELEPDITIAASEPEPQKSVPDRPESIELGNLELDLSLSSDEPPPPRVRRLSRDVPAVDLTTLGQEAAPPAPLVITPEPFTPDPKLDAVLPETAPGHIEAAHDLAPAEAPAPIFPEPGLTSSESNGPVLTETAASSTAKPRRERRSTKPVFDAPLSMALGEEPEEFVPASKVPPPVEVPPPILAPTQPGELADSSPQTREPLPDLADLSGLDNLPPIAPPVVPSSGDPGRSPTTDDDPFADDPFDELSRELLNQEAIAERARVRLLRESNRDLVGAPTPAADKTAPTDALLEARRQAQEPRGVGVHVSTNPDTSDAAQLEESIPGLELMSIPPPANEEVQRANSSTSMMAVDDVDAMLPMTLRSSPPPPMQDPQRHTKITPVAGTPVPEGAGLSRVVLATASPARMGQVRRAFQTTAHVVRVESVRDLIQSCESAPRDSSIAIIDFVHPPFDAPQLDVALPVRSVVVWGADTETQAKLTVFDGARDWIPCSAATTAEDLASLCSILIFQQASG